MENTITGNQLKEIRAKQKRKDRTLEAFARKIGYKSYRNIIYLEKRGENPVTDVCVMRLKLAGLIK